MNCSEEIWKGIPDYPIYKVSTLGNVKRITGNTKGRKAGDYLKPVPNDHGYLRVTITNKKGSKSITIHRLVATTFLEPDPDPQRWHVNHKNGIRSDNRLENLGWCSIRENRLYSIENFDTMHGEKMGNAKLSKSDIIQIHELRMKGWSPSKIAKHYPASAAHIGRIIRRQWRARELANYSTDYPPVKLY